jgi:hypothetical protein
MHKNLGEIFSLATPLTPGRSWQQTARTSSNERIRFQKVIDLMQAETCGTAAVGRAGG